MSGFLYYCPGARGQVTTQLLADFGLSHIRDSDAEALHAREVVSNGPGGYPGLVIGNRATWQSEEVKQSDSIEWVRFPKSHAPQQAWLGWMKDQQLPTPAELARSKQLPGQWLQFADDNKWLVPVARDCEGYCQLPIAYDLDEEDGSWQPTKVRREYQKIWDHALAYYSALYLAVQQSASESSETGLTSVSFQVPNARELVIDALAVNYRVSDRELATLGVLVTGLVQQVAEILIDVADDDQLKKVRA